MAESERYSGRTGRIRHRGFLDQWLTEVDQERRLKASAESLQSVGKRLPQSMPQPVPEPDRDEASGRWR